MTEATVADRGSGEESNAAILEVRGLRIERADNAEPIVTNLDLRLFPGETIGIVGESGSGKSMSAKSMIGLLPDGIVARGSIELDGENVLDLTERGWREVRGRRIGMVMQDPFTMLNPVMKCGRIIEESLLPDRQRSRSERRAEAIRRLAEVGISDATVVDRYPFQLSGGMRQRVAIAAALARDPQVLIADEPSTALDSGTQREVLALMKRIQAARGMALILITHDLRVAFAVCDRIHVLYAGSVLESGRSTAMLETPLHPYTQGLLLSEPPADRRVRELVAIPGSVPKASAVTGICPFEPRCAWAAQECRDSMPDLLQVEPHRASRCTRLPAIRAQMVALSDRAEAPVTDVDYDRPAQSVIELTNVGKVFDTAGRSVPAVDGVSLTVRAGESVGIVGESGSGKTTVARMLVGLETPSFGSMTIDGISMPSWRSLSRSDRQRLRRTVQTVFQDPYSSLHPKRSIGWTLREALTMHEPDAKKLGPRIGELLESVGLAANYAERPPSALSGGERQRVSIARALAVNPRVLICDEPVSALDMSVQAQILNLLARVRDERGISCVFITHDLSVVRQAADHLYVMYRGKVVESGSTAAVLDNPQAGYTARLIASAPQAGGSWLEERAELTGRDVAS